jgi:hypothetical protein
VTPTLDLGGSSEETLQLLVGGDQEQPEMLFLIERPDAQGAVRLRSWTSNDWSAEPSVVMRQATDLLRDVEQWVRHRRRLNHELSVVRRWLTARP